jgi:predicted RNA-binding protein associated with RNAse of E/G family
LIGEIVTIRYRRLPADERLFRQRLVAELPECVVTLLDSAPVSQPVIAGGATVLEPGAPVVWFTYPGLWYDIGRFHLADGTFTGLYANILTPVRMDGRDWETTDLLLDVWLGIGGEAEILDEEEFGAAVQAGWLDRETAVRARATAASLAAGAAVGSWPPPHVHEWTLEAARSRLGREKNRPATK